jgi:hypothetical protein
VNPEQYTDSQHCSKPKTYLSRTGEKEACRGGGLLPENINLINLYTPNDHKRSKVNLPKRYN